jgi:hypothetical protein
MSEAEPRTPGRRLSQTADRMPHSPLLGATELRMAALGFGWADVTATQVYTIFDTHPLFADEIVRRAATPGGLTWHFARPAVQGLDLEMDVPGIAPKFTI